MMPKALRWRIAWIRKKIRKAELSLRDWLIRRNPLDEDGIILLPVPKKRIKMPETVTLKASRVMEKRTRDFLGEELVRMTLVDKVKEQIWQQMSFSETWEEEIGKYICTAEITIVKEEQTWQKA